MTRRKLAEATGISERFLADIENAKANPSLLRLVQLSEALGSSVASLLGDANADSGPGGGRDGRPARQLIALLGLRGAGKSTVGPILARRLGCDFLELDQLVEERAGLPLNELFSLHGEDWFRDAEHEALAELLAEGQQVVLATSGGIVTNEAAWAALRRGAQTVWLRARPEDHWQRVVAQGDTRPMRNRARAFGELRELLTEREAQYQAADRTVETSGRGAHQVAAAIADQLAGPPAAAG